MQEFSVYSSVNWNISKQNATNINFVPLAFTLYMNFHITASISEIQKLFTGLAINLWPGKNTFILFLAAQHTVQAFSQVLQKSSVSSRVFLLLGWVYSQAHFVHNILRADRTVQGGGQSWPCLTSGEQPACGDMGTCSESRVHAFCSYGST